MKKISLGETVSILANVGVIAGIIFLAIEIGQNTEMMEAQMDQGRAELAVAVATAEYNSEYMPEILVLIDQGETLSAEQMYRYQAYLRGFHRIQDNLLGQYQRGLLGQDIESSIRRAVRAYVAESEIARDRWEVVRRSYSIEYSTLVDNEIEAYLASAGSE